jgi:chromosome segregation ATPase
MFPLLAGQFAVWYLTIQCLVGIKFYNRRNTTMTDEEDKFYTWDEIEKELSDLELQYGDSDEIVRSIITPSVSSYWRKKLEEEKILYEKMLQTKEEEKKQIMLKLQQQEQIIEDLKKQMERLEHGEYEKLKDKYEELRRKELELEKEKEKLVWQQQIQGLEFDKKVVEQEITRVKEEFEQQKQELLVYYNRQFDSLLDVQKQLLDETNRLEKEIDSIISSTKEEISKYSSQKEAVEKELVEMKNLLEKIKQEKEGIINENIVLKQKIDNLIQQNVQDKKQLVVLIAQNVKNYVSEIRSLCGIIIGATNFVTKYKWLKNLLSFIMNLS